MMPPGGANARADQFEALERIHHARLTDPALGALLDEARAVGGVRRPRLATTCGSIACSRATTTRPCRCRPTWRRRCPPRTRTRSSPGWRRASGRLHALRTRARAPARAAGAVHRVLRRLGRVRAPVRRPARRLRARPDHRRAHDAVHAPPGGARPARLGGGRGGGGRAHLPGPTSRPRTRRRSRTSCCARSATTTEHWRLDPSVHPFARSHGDTDVRLTTRWEPDDLAMSIYSCLHEFGHGLYEAQFVARALPDDARAMPPGSASTSPRAGCGRTSSAARKPFCEWVLPIMQRHLRRRPFEAMDASELYRAVNQVRLGADPDRGRRDDLQPAHRAAVRARAGDGRGAARRRRPARTPGTRRRTGCSGSRRRR